MAYSTLSNHCLRCSLCFGGFWQASDRLIPSRLDIVRKTNDISDFGVLTDGGGKAVGIDGSELEYRSIGKFG